MAIPEQNQSRFAYIDALRGWAIILVIFGHAAGMTRLTGPLRTFTDGCMMGVHLFFVISAFTIFYMYSKHAAAESRPVRNFFIRRFLRIAPVYWLAIIYYQIIWGGLKPDEAWHYPMHVLFLHSLHPDPQTSVVPGGWSISIEMLFYLTVPLWFKKIRDLTSARNFVLVCVFLLPPVVWLIRPLLDPCFAGVKPYLVTVYWERFPLISIGCFAFGILMFYLLKNERIARLIKDKKVNIAGFMIAGAMLAALPYLEAGFPVKAHFYSALFMAVMLLLSARPWTVFVNPVTQFFGRVSYSMYIFHFSIVTWLYYGFTNFFPQITHHPYLYFLAFFAMSIVCSLPAAWLGYQFIERPAIEFSKRWVARLEQRASNGR